MSNHASEIDAICADCGLSHDRATRQRVLERLGDAERDEIVAAYPCLFGGVCHRTLHRDRRALRARAA